MDLNTGSLIIEYVFHGKLPMVLVMLIVVNLILELGTRNLK